ncbi:MAG: YdjC family protein [Acidobacteriales bacterium]|nr:YdjC family protein [Terriglobales bacterium]
MRRLIINADDFGLTAGVNRAISECNQAGTVTSATLMANATAFLPAVEIARASPKLRVGCHVVLIDGAPVSRPDSVRSLLTPGTNLLRTAFTDFASVALRNKLSPDEIATEAAAQLRKIQSAGIELTHFDTHKHTHMFPQVLRPLLRAAKECGIRAVRNPFVPLKALAIAHILRQPKLWVRYSEVNILRRYAAAFQAEVKQSGLRTTDGTFGIVATGALDQNLFNAIVGSVPEGTWEFVCHPGYNDSDLSEVATRLRASRDAERDVLTSPESKQQLQRHGIELISYAEL